MAIKNIIFDWSGTLSNDFVPVYKATMMIFDHFRIKRISIGEYRREFVLPYMDFYRKYKPDMDREEEEALFIEAINSVEEPELYEGVKTALAKLVSMGMSLVVVSSHPHEKLIGEAKAYGISGFFSEIKGSVYIKSGGIREVMERNGFNPKETVYVGDMQADVLEGKKAGVMTVAISWGYQDAERLKKSNPDNVISGIKELQDAISAIS
jgi:phosphoglycolate phosphatase